MTKKFTQLKEEFKELLKDKSPCSGEYRRVLNSETEAELLQVIYDNLSWCVDKKCIPLSFLLKFTSKVLLESGLANTGKENSGVANSGNWNSGDRNSGDSNSGYRNSGAFCTDSNPRLVLFDVQTDILIKDWERMDACRIMESLNPNIWVWSSEMTIEEKANFPTYETTGGYLKSIPYKEAWLNLWGNLTDDKKKVFTDLPNFNKGKFKEITGIDTV